MCGKVNISNAQTQQQQIEMYYNIRSDGVRKDRRPLIAAPALISLCIIHQ